jgi:predicted ferric reductase
MYSASTPSPNNDASFHPYSDSINELPLLSHFLSFPFRPLVFVKSHLPRFFRIRWQFTYPLQTRLPNSTLTFGEVLFVPLLFGLYMKSFIDFNGDFANPSGEADDSGGTAGVAAGLAVITATQNSLITFLVGIPFERALFYHKCFAYAAVIIGFWHGAHSYALDAAGKGEDEDDDRPPVPYKISFSSSVSFSFEDTTNTSGSLFCLAMLGLILTSLPPIRRRIFEAFYKLHIILFLVVLVCSLLHESGASTFACAYYVADVIFRQIYLSFYVYPSQCRISCLPSNVVKVDFPREYAEGKTFLYNGGQYIFLMVPQLSIFQWHPFSISSAPHEARVSVHVRVLGDWTSHLQQLGSKLQKQSSTPLEPAPLKAYISGPMGCPSVDLDSDRYKCVLLISGGIGITPMQSITNQLLHEHESSSRPLKKIYFVWSVRDKDMISAVRENLPNNVQERTTTKSYPFVPDLVKKSSSRLFSSSVSPTELESNNINEDDAESDHILHSEYYLTRGGDSYIDGEKIIKGRPDTYKICQKMAKYARIKGEVRVAVLVCGPGALVASARNASASVTRETGIQFDFHSETFDF